MCHPVTSNDRKGAKVSKVTKMLYVLGNRCQRKEETPIREGPGPGCGAPCMAADGWTGGQRGCSWDPQLGSQGGHWEQLDFPSAEVWLM